MMPFTWSWIFILLALLVRPGYSNHSNLVNNDILPRDPNTNDILLAAPAKQSPNPAPIVIGVLIGLAIIVGLVALFLFLRKRRRRMSHLEDGVAEKSPYWWMVDHKSEKTMDWWRLDHDIPPRVEGDKSRTSNLDRIRDAFKLTRKGATRGRQKETSPGIPIQFPPTPSPTESIGHPQAAVPNPQPRYPSILERGYQDRMYPTSPSSPKRHGRPLIPSEEGSPKRKVKLPPRALIVPPHGRPIPGLSERKVGSPRTPTNRRKSWLSKHHPFLPVKDPIIPTSAPILKGGHSMQPHYVPAWVTTSKSGIPPSPLGPRSDRARRIPAPDTPDRRAPPVLPPMQVLPPLQEGIENNDVRRNHIVIPPGLSPGYPRKYPQPI